MGKVVLFIGNFKNKPKKAISV